MLAQEPWCGFPEQIASLTDWQIEHLYARPAIERAKQIERERKGDSPILSIDTSTSTIEPSEPNSLEFRVWVISQFMAMGMSRAAAEKQYEGQARNYKPE